jgi:hypothetical protein
MADKINQKEIYNIAAELLTDLFRGVGKITIQELENIRNRLPEYEKKLDEIKRIEGEIVKELSDRVSYYLNKHFGDSPTAREYILGNPEALQKYIIDLANRDESIRKMVEEYNYLRSEKYELEGKIKIATVAHYLPTDKLKELIDNPPKGGELYKKIEEIMAETMKNYLEKRNRERKRYSSIIISTILSFLSLSTLLSFIFLFLATSEHSTTAQAVSYNFLSSFYFIFSLMALILFLVFLKIQRRNY